MKSLHALHCTKRSSGTLDYHQIYIKFNFKISQDKVMATFVCILIEYYKISYFFTLIHVNM